MSDDRFDFGELRSLLQQAPSREVWEALCALVFPARWEKAADQWLPYAQDHLDRHWPDHLRQWPERWWGRKKIPSATALVRVMTLQQPSEAQLKRALDALAASDAPLVELRATLRGVSQRDDEQGQAEALLAALPRSVRRLRLRLMDMSGVGAREALRGRLAGLELLSLQQVGLTDASLGGLLSAPELGALEELRIAHEPGVTARAGELLARSGLAAQLRRLDLSHTRITHRSDLLSPEQNAEESGLRELAAARWERLEEVRLSGVGADAEGVDVMLRAMPGLRGLDVSRNGALGDALHIEARLTSLNMAECGLGDLACAAMLGRGSLGGLRELRLDCNPVGEACGEALVRSGAAAQLRRLDASNLPGGAGGLLRGLGAARLDALDTLVLHGAGDDPALVPLLSQLQLPALRVLIISSALKDSGLEGLREAPWASHVERMFLT
jgi:hypothetical protein